MSVAIDEVLLLWEFRFWDEEFTKVSMVFSYLGFNAFHFDKFKVAFVPTHIV